MQSLGPLLVARIPEGGLLVTVAAFRLAFTGFVLLGAFCAVGVSALGFNFASKAGRGRAGVHKGSELLGTEEHPDARAPKALSQPVNTAPHTAGKPGAISGTSGLVRSSSPFQLSGRDWGAGMASAQGLLAWSTRRPLSGPCGRCPGGGLRTSHPLRHLVPDVKSGRALRDLATNAAHLCGVEPALFHALIERESSWRPFVVSSSGAVGLGQIKPSTLRDIDPTLNAWEPWDNLLGSACYLRRQFDRFGSWRLALHAYHAGPNRKATKQATHDYATDIIEGAN